MCKRLPVVFGILIAFHVPTTLTQDSQFHEHLTDKQIRGIMAPKMDYDEWTPLGRGDPLKNDPTFDYSPPMVGKVKYWINPLFRTPDPPIVPNRSGDEATTETSQLYTATTSKTVAPSKSTGDIKRFYIDLKDHTDMTYVQLLNSKYNKLARPATTYTRQPPPPLPMLVPPPPIEPSSYSSAKIENSTAVELSWDLPKTTAVPVTQAGAHFTTSAAPLLPSTRGTNKADAFSTTTSVLKNLLSKDRATSTTLQPLTPNPTKKPKATYLIIQGHSKVKKYGTSKLDRVDVATLQDTNEISDVRYELPREARAGRQLTVEDFLPFGGLVKELIANQAEGSGIGAELTKAMFPSYVRPTTTLQYDQPRVYEDGDDVYYA